jgi:hypothetical protein
LLVGRVAENTSAATRPGFTLAISLPLLVPSASWKPSASGCSSIKALDSAECDKNGEGLIELFNHVERLAGERSYPTFSNRSALSNSMGWPPKPASHRAVIAALTASFA